MKGRRSPEAIEALIVLVALGLVLAAAAGGFFVGRATKSSTATSSMTMAPVGHIGGGNLPVSEIGNPARGAQVFVSKRCADCHSYYGRGGEDAPPLDSMRGHLSATEIAEMSGQIWDHLPSMLGYFKEEEIPVPTFQGSQMADLIAYLHSGKGGAPPVRGGMKPGMNMTSTASMSSGMMTSTPTK